MDGLTIGAIGPVALVAGALVALILWKVAKLAIKVVAFVLGVLVLGGVVALYVLGGMPGPHGDVPRLPLPESRTPG